MADGVYFLGDSNLNRMANQILKKRIFKTKHGNNYYQLAVSGQCSKELLTQLKTIQFEASTVVLMIGTNDALKKTSFRQYEFALQSIFKEIRNKKVIFCTVLPILRLEHPNILLKNYNEIVKSFRPYSNVTILDVYSYFVTTENKISFEYFENDNLHLNQRGLQKLWDLINDLLY